METVVPTSTRGKLAPPIAKKAPVTPPPLATKDTQEEFVLSSKVMVSAEMLITADSGILMNMRGELF